MKIRSQVGMVLNLDKCIGCHTCSVTCKNVWTGREGMEYAWFNNVETKPGIGYPKNWEDQDEWQGGWVRDVNGKIRPRLGSKMGVITKIFANPVVPQIDDYYEPFTFDYEHLHSAPEGKHIPTARPRSLIDGKRMDKVIWGPNWEELLGGEFEKRARDRNFEAMQKEMYGQFENTFMMYLPRLCEHCLNPSCVATCPSVRQSTKWRWTGNWRYRCTLNTAPCRWSGTFLHCHRFSLTLMRAACRKAKACCPPSKACVFRCNISPIC